MNYIKGIFKDRSEIQARMLFFRLEDVVSLKLKNFFNVAPLKTKAQGWTKEKENVPKQEKNPVTLTKVFKHLIIIYILVVQLQNSLKFQSLGRSYQLPPRNTTFS